MADPSRKRLQSMQRVLAVREDMRRREELKLANLAREAAVLREAQTRLEQFIASEAGSGGPLFEHAARSHRKLHVRAAELATEHAAQGKRVLVQARHEKLAERRVEDLTETVQREDEKREVAEWVERAATRPTSLP